MLGLSLMFFSIILFFISIIMKYCHSSSLRVRVLELNTFMKRNSKLYDENSKMFDKDSHISNKNVENLESQILLQGNSKFSPENLESIDSLLHEESMDLTPNTSKLSSENSNFSCEKLEITDSIQRESIDSMQNIKDIKILDSYNTSPSQRYFNPLDSQSAPNTLKSLFLGDRLQNPAQTTQSNIRESQILSNITDSQHAFAIHDDTMPHKKRFYLQKYLLVFVIFALLYIPCYEGFSTLTLIYSLFDVPSVLCTILSICLGFSIIMQDFCNFKNISCTDNKICNVFLVFFDLLRQKCDSKRKFIIKDYCTSYFALSLKAGRKLGFYYSSSSFYGFLCLALFGLVVYGNHFKIFTFDVYYANVWIQALLVVIFVGIVFCKDRFFALLIVLSFIPFACGYALQLNIFEFIICPYLWCFSVGYVVVQSIVRLLHFFYH